MNTTKPVDKPVIRFYFARMKQAFHDLPEEEKTAFMRTDRENLDQLGMKAITMVDCSWSSKEWDYVGVEEWPSLETIREREKFEQEVLDVSRYVESKVLLGTAESYEEYGKG